MRSLLRKKQDTAWSPMSLLVIKPCCQQLHWNYPGYPLGQPLTFANTKRCNRPILPGPWARSTQTGSYSRWSAVVWSCVKAMVHPHRNTPMLTALLQHSCTRANLAGEFTFQKTRRRPTSKPCLGLELSFLHLSALFSCKLSSSSYLKTSYTRTDMLLINLWSPTL